MLLTIITIIYIYPNNEILSLVILTGVMEARIKENITWSVLNLHYVQRMWQRDGGDGLLMFYLLSTVYINQGLSNTSEYLEIWYQSFVFIFRNSAFTFNFVGCFTSLMQNTCVFFFKVNHIHILARSIVFKVQQNDIRSINVKIPILCLLYSYNINTHVGWNVFSLEKILLLWQICMTYVYVEIAAGTNIRHFKSDCLPTRCRLCDFH